MSRGGFSSKLHVLCQGRGLPITVALNPGQQDETTMVETLLEAVSIAGKRGRPRTRFATVAADKTYDSAPTRAQRFDTRRYRRRTVVERLIGKTPHRHAIRQAGRKLPGYGRARIHPRLPQNPSVVHGLAEPVNQNGLAVTPLF